MIPPEHKHDHEASRVRRAGDWCFCGHGENYRHCLATKEGAKGAASGVRVNSVAPGLVKTPILGDMPDETLVAFAGATQLVPRPSAPEEIANVVIFLASEDATMVTGSTYTMDGGWAMKA